jgi:hypothetical protein
MGFQNESCCAILDLSQHHQNLKNRTLKNTHTINFCSKYLTNWPSSLSQRAKTMNYVILEKEKKKGGKEKVCNSMI